MLGRWAYPFYPPQRVFAAMGPVGMKEANLFGLFEMPGNFWERREGCITVMFLHSLMQVAKRLRVKLMGIESAE